MINILKETKNRNLSKFHYNILESIDEIDKRIHKIEENFEKKNEPEKDEKNTKEEKDSEKRIR